MPQVDYAKLAAQHGGKPSAPPVDYAALARELGGSPPASQEETVAPRSMVDRVGDVLERVANTAEDFSIGGIYRSGVGRTLYNSVRELSRVLPGDRYTLPETQFFEPKNTAERAGQLVENMAEFAAPSGLVKAGVAKVAGSAPKLATVARVGLESASAGAVAAAQGRDATTAALTAGALTGASAVAGKAVPALRKAAGEKVMQALGPTKERFKAMAARLTPGILQRGLSGSRTAILEQAAQRANEVGGQIDDAIQLYGARQVGTQPIVEALESAKGVFQTSTRMTVAEAVQKGVADRAKDVGDGLVEVAVVFEPRAIKQLNGLQRIVNEVGDTASVEQLVAIRRAWDKVVDQAGGYAHRAGGAIGQPLKDQTEAWAKREATGAIRKVLADDVPELAKLNAEFAFWKGLKDVLTQTVQRTQPQSGGLLKQTAEVAGAAAGSSHGIGVALLAGKAAKMAQAAFTSPRWRLLDARMRTSLADAIESGNSQRIMGQLTRVSAALGSRLEPSTVEP